jgi:alpha-mannosidase
MSSKASRPRRVFLVPHTHFDAEVFITREETLRIGASNLWLVLRLLRDHPELTFAIDQVCYLRPFLERFPEAREQLVDLVRSGRVELVGGMHAMPDLNIPSGESLIRQVLHGREFFESLGADVRCAWTLDCFGHHPQIPQILAKCGYDWSAGQRLRPAGSAAEFHYEGLDGTRLVFAWLPASYCVLTGCPLDFPSFRAFVDSRLGYLEAACAGPELLAISGGDIDAPPPSLPDLVARYNEAQDRYAIEFSTPSKYLEVLRSRADLPVVSGDLNPVFQGCYSARIAVKQRNRALETALLDRERTAAFAALVGKATRDPAADADDLRDAWEPVLFNQGHDIICGSHVDSVYNAALARFAYSEERARLGTAASLRSIAEDIDTRGPGTKLAVFNTLGHTRSDVVECVVAFADPGAVYLEVRSSSGTVMPSDLLSVERFPDGSVRTATVLFVARDVPSLGYEVYSVVPLEEQPALSAPELRTSEPWNIRSDRERGFIENAACRLSFDMWNGTITSIRHKPGDWEVVSRAMPWANTVVREPDFGNFWQYNGPCKGDAFHPTPALYPLSAENANGVSFAHHTHGDGNIRQGRASADMTISHPFGSGHFATRVRLYAGLPRIDIRTTLTNEDERVRYRAVFPTTLAGGEVTHEIPFGAIARPEGEFPAQTWMDCSRDGHGLALLNRGLPGNNAAAGVMMLSLLKCTALKEGYGEVGGFRFGIPTEEGYERGRTHVFDYALLPHLGDWREARAYAAGQEINTPLLAVRCASHAGQLPPRHSWLGVSHPNMVLSAVRRTERGTIALRVYEAEGRGVPEARIHLGVRPAAAAETDLIGRNARPFAGASGNGLAFSLGAFEIKTFELTLP